MSKKHKTIWIETYNALNSCDRISIELEKLSRISKRLSSKIIDHKDQEYLEISMRMIENIIHGIKLQKMNLFDRFEQNYQLFNEENV